MEYDYDQFLEKKCQLLLLLNNMDEIIEIRDALILRVDALRREQRMSQINNAYECMNT